MLTSGFGGKGVVAPSERKELVAQLVSGFEMPILFNLYTSKLKYRNIGDSFIPPLTWVECGKLPSQFRQLQRKDLGAHSISVGVHNAGPFQFVFIKDKIQE